MNKYSNTYNTLKWIENTEVRIYRRNKFWNLKSKHRLNKTGTETKKHRLSLLVKESVATFQPILNNITRKRGESWKYCFLVCVCFYKDRTEKKENVFWAEQPLFKRLRVVKQLCGNPRGSLPKTVKLIFTKSSKNFQRSKYV